MEVTQILFIILPFALAYIVSKIYHKKINTPPEKIKIILPDIEQLIGQLHKLNSDKIERINEIIKKIENSIDKMEQMNLLLLMNIKKHEQSQKKKRASKIEN